MSASTAVTMAQEIADLAAKTDRQWTSASPQPNLITETGLEFVTANRRVRVVAIDGEWVAGFEVHVLTRNCVSLASATVHANTCAALAVRVADALFDRMEER